MKCFYQQDKKNKYKYLGDLLLSTRNNSKMKKRNESFGEMLLMINSFEKSFQYKTIFKACEKSLNKNQSEASSFLSNFKNKGDNKNISRNFKLSQIAKSRFIYDKGFYTSKKRLNKSSYEKKKLNNDREKMSKSLLFKKFPSLEDELYNLGRKYKNNSMDKYNYNSEDKKIIYIPKESNKIDFRKNINLRMKILKNDEKKNIMKKNVLKKIYNILGEKEYNNIKHIMEERQFDEEVINDKNPFKIRKNKYKNIFNQLQKEYGFYPYNYLEEHKDIDSNAFKFMVDNFNSKFSLFGNDKIINDGYRTNYKKKLIFKIEKPSYAFIKRIKRIESKEKMNKIKNKI